MPSFYRSFSILHLDGLKAHPNLLPAWVFMVCTCVPPSAGMHKTVNRIQRGQPRMPWEIWPAPWNTGNQERAASSAGFTSLHVPHRSGDASYLLFRRPRCRPELCSWAPRAVGHHSSCRGTRAGGEHVPVERVHCAQQERQDSQRDGH